MYMYVCKIDTYTCLLVSMTSQMAISHVCIYIRIYILPNMYKT